MKRVPNDLERGGFGAGAAAIERELRRFVPGPVPAGLRERALARAAGARRGAALAPWLRVAAASCAVFIAALLALDPILSRHEEARLAALLDGRAISANALESAPELAEAGIGLGTEAARWSRLQGLAAAAALKAPERVSLEALERLKERWDYETPQDPD